MKLVITEKSSVARTLARHMGPGYAMVALSGHISGVDYAHKLSEKPWKSVPLSTLVRTPLVQKPLANMGCTRLQSALTKSYEEVILALDPDPQGYTIAHDVRKKISPGVPVYSIDLEALDRKGVLAALAQKKPYTDRGIQGDIKRKLDFLMGTILTRAVSLYHLKKSSKWFTYTVGRVQSITLRYIRDRAQQIDGFRPETCDRYWLDHVKTPWVRKQEVGLQVKVTPRHTVDKKVYPFRGYNTDELISACARLPLFLGKGPTIAKHLEQLYLKGEISYPRTDNNDYANFPDLLRASAKVYEDHAGIPAIIPRLSKKETPADHGPISILKGHADGDSPETGAIKATLLHRCAKIYSGINEYRVTEYEISHPTLGTCSHEVWLQVTKRFDDHKKSWKVLPSWSHTLTVKPQTTRAPPRYNFSLLMEKMAAEGVGTKSTRSTIIQNLLYRKYVTSQGYTYHLTPPAHNVLDHLQGSFILQKGFTRSLEEMSRTMTRQTAGVMQQDHRNILSSFLQSQTSP